MTDDPETARARAEERFQRKQVAAEEGAEARAEYETNRKATLDRMAQLKALRLAREASEGKAAVQKVRKAKRPKSRP